ncbi:MAG: hypothetical protein ABIT37_01610 [Luteolibacter sp.]
MRNIFNLLLPKPVSKDDLIYGSEWNLIIKALASILVELRAVTVQSSGDIVIKRDNNGSFARLRRRIRGGSAAAAGPCPFGEIITYTEGTDSDSESKTGIRGGYLKAGKKYWRVPNWEGPAEDGKYPVWLRIDVTANTDSTNVATLSGLKTSERPTWEHGEESDDYEDQVIPDQFPTSDPGAGVSIVPLGVMTVADGKKTLDRTGCGNIHLTHCPGVLDYYRGPTGSDSDSATP